MDCGRMWSPLNVAALCVLFVGQGNAQNYSYEGANGPSNWPNTFPLCGGIRQSPINIVTYNTRRTTLPRLYFSSASRTAAPAVLRNTGKSAEVDLTPSQPITLQGGPLNGTYQFLQFHLHWGQRNGEGSEHAVNGNFYPMELHMVFFNQKYGNGANALNFTDGVAVVGVFLQSSFWGNWNLQEIVEGLQEVTDAGSETDLPSGFVLDSLLPWQHDVYYTYLGSLTTPFCAEAVTWIVFSQPITVANWQINEFRTLLTEAGSPLSTNRRPLQSLGNRTVYWISYRSHSHFRTGGKLRRGSRKN